MVQRNTRTICLFILYIDEPVLEAAPTEGELPANGVGLGDLAQPVHQSALARAHVTCTCSTYIKNLSPLLAKHAQVVRGHSMTFLSQRREF